MTTYEFSCIANDFCNAYGIDADDFFKSRYQLLFADFVANHEIFLRGRSVEGRICDEYKEMCKTKNIELMKQLTALTAKLDEMKAVIKKHHLQRFFK